MQKRRLVITRHARERASQFQLPLNKLVWMFWNAEEEPAPPNADMDGRDKNSVFLRHGTHVMVAVETIDKFHGDEIYLLLTVYNQEIDLPAEALNIEGQVPKGKYASNKHKK